MYESICPIVRAVGVTDTQIDLFESQYPVPHGITYNSYVVRGNDAVALMDTVDAAFADQWLQNVHEALEGALPAYLVVLHLEPDHSGTIARAMQHYPDMRLVASAKAMAMLPHFFPEAAEWADRLHPVADGDELSLGGGVTLRFTAAPMVHWPEVLVAYEISEGTLFAADAFGTFGTPGHPQPWAPEAARYYFNICGKYGTQVQALLKKVGTLPLKRICSLHGPVLEGADITAAVTLYDLWSRYEPDLDGVFLPYASIYGNTAEAAARLALMLEERGVSVSMLDLARCDMAEAVSLAFRHPVLILAAATYDAAVFPPMAEFLHHIGAKGFRNRRVGIMQNGSWAPVAARAMRKLVDEMKDITIIEPEITIHTRLADTDLPALEALADAVATR